jgi:hypothetical protein
MAPNPRKPPNSAHSLLASSRLTYPPAQKPQNAPELSHLL